MKITGYGRGWQEPKAKGMKRILQIGREPASTTTWYAASIVFVLVVCIAVIFAA